MTTTNPYYTSTPSALGEQFNRLYRNGDTNVEKIGESKSASVEYKDQKWEVSQVDTHHWFSAEGGLPYETQRRSFRSGPTPKILEEAQSVFENRILPLFSEDSVWQLDECVSWDSHAPASVYYNMEAGARISIVSDEYGINNVSFIRVELGIQVNHIFINDETNTNFDLPEWEMGIYDADCYLLLGSLPMYDHCH